METSVEDAVPSIILGVPGMWEDRQHFLRSVVESSEFHFAADVLYHRESKRAVSVDLYQHDPRMAGVFEVAGGNRIAPAEVAAIGRHTMTAYLIGPGGSFENARFMVHAASAILKAGGLGVKVESAGIAHSRAQWLEFDREEPLIYGPDAFVIFAQGKGATYSCGMHNLGFRDAVFSESPADAVNMLRLFLRYCVTPEHPMSERDTVTLGSVKYRLAKMPCTTFGAGSHFYNPYGLWRLDAGAG